eukprot:GHVS01034286.1.p1 GENE.GHVS01034286.1~~GHVS01034286.1.p1  ORF type:complete len:134 (+),score=29.81 GHVS01034286.1:524-925(+)
MNFFVNRNILFDISQDRIGFLASTCPPHSYRASSPSSSALPPRQQPPKKRNKSNNPFEEPKQIRRVVVGWRTKSVHGLVATVGLVLMSMGVVVALLWIAVTMVLAKCVKLDYRKITSNATGGTTEEHFEEEMY